MDIDHMKSLFLCNWVPIEILLILHGQLEYKLYKIINLMTEINKLMSK